MYTLQCDIFGGRRPDRMIAAVLADRAFSRQLKMRNLANSLSKLSNEVYPEAAIHQFKTLFLNPTNVLQILSIH